MGDGRRTMPFGLHVLLLALAIQGVTPDARDLTSTTLFRLADAISEGADADAERGKAVGLFGFPLRSQGDSTAPEEEQDELPDEVCGVATTRIRLTARGRQGERRALESVDHPLGLRGAPTSDPRGLRGRPRGEPSARNSRRIYALCRMIC